MMGKHRGVSHNEGLHVRDDTNYKVGICLA